MTVKFSSFFSDPVLREKLLFLIQNFQEEGELLNNGQRNSIKIFEVDGISINVKSFKVPHWINKIAYRFVRKSKAQRSFEYAHALLKKGIGTPQPIAYVIDDSGFTFGKSFYASQHLIHDLTYRELVENPNYPDHENILRAFTRFTYLLHEKGVEFLDHSPGNTLIQHDNGNYKFFLVDLNRMNFRRLSFDDRMKNFSRLTPKKEMVRIMAKEYANLTKLPQEKIFKQMWFYTSDFQKNFQKKQKFKSLIKSGNKEV